MGSYCLLHLCDYLVVECLHLNAESVSEGHHERRRAICEMPIFDCGRIPFHTHTHYRYHIAWFVPGEGHFSYNHPPRPGCGWDGAPRGSCSTRVNGGLRGKTDAKCLCLSSESGFKVSDICRVSRSESIPATPTIQR